MNRIVYLSNLCRLLPSFPTRQEENPEFAQDMADIEASVEFLSPSSSQLVWHQDQVGIIPNSCPESPHSYWEESVSFHDGSDASDGAGGGIDAGRGDGNRRRDEVSRGGQTRYTHAVQRQKKPTTFNHSPLPKQGQCCTFLNGLLQ